MYCQLRSLAVVRAPQTTGHAAPGEDPQRVDAVEVDEALVGVGQPALEADGTGDADVRGRLVHAAGGVGLRVDAGDVPGRRLRPRPGLGPGPER